jgi:uncharacterized damage-inducible protein DinB
MTRPAEVWLRGPVPGIQPALQPVAHALLQVAEDLPRLLENLTTEQVWARHGRSAAIGFHLAHLSGSLDRLFTYARGEALSQEQLAVLTGERGLYDTQPSIGTLLEKLDAGVQRALEQLRRTRPDELEGARLVGRQQLPSTTLGLLVHAAEHTARHAGQISTLLKLLPAT